MMENREGKSKILSKEERPSATRSVYDLDGRCGH